MHQIKRLLAVTLTLCMIFGLAGYIPEKANAAEAIPTISYMAHVMNIGDMAKVKNGETAGTVGRNLRMESFFVYLKNGSKSMVQYRAHVQDRGWMDWKESGYRAGTMNNKLRLEAVQIRLTGEYAQKYDVIYRAHIKDIGWLDWAKNGESAGSEGYAIQMEALQIKLVSKNAFKTSGVPFVKDPGLTYSSYVRGQGWKGNVKAAQTSGTTGRDLPLYGLKVNLKDYNGANGVNYRVHVCDAGWLDWKKTGEEAGQTSLERQIEAVQIKLVGNLSKYFDIYYHVHIRNVGWLGWTKNGQSAGTEGMSAPVEAIAIKLVAKGYNSKENNPAFAKKPTIKYKAHVSNIGDISFVGEDKVCGTIGRSLSMESLTIQCTDDKGNSQITYRTHVQDEGWGGWGNSNNESGSRGKNRKLEAVQIKLTGSLATFMDIYYRPHVENKGWMGWAKNGEPAGTTGGNLGMEAITIKLVPKGANVERCGAAFEEIVRLQPTASRAEAIVEVAKSQLGKKERAYRSDNIEYNDWFYGKQVKNPNSSECVYPWCAVFVSWCAEKAGIPQNIIPKTAGCTDMKDKILKSGGVKYLKGSGYAPKRGDIIFFGSNASQHVGIVDYTSGDTIYYIDGNNTNSKWNGYHGVNNSSISLSKGNYWGTVTPAYNR